jgi:hypothetical protein
MQKETATVQNILSLASVLDRIDSTQPKAAETEVASSSSVTTLLEIAKTQEIDWYEYIDPNSGKSYYHKFKTNETSWDKPERFHPYLPTGPTAASTSTANYSAGAYFNQGDGRFTVSGTSTYWEQVIICYFSAINSLILTSLDNSKDDRMIEQEDSLLLS